MTNRNDTTSRTGPLGAWQLSRRSLLGLGLVGGAALTFERVFGSEASPANVTPQFILSGGASSDGILVHSTLSAADQGALVDLAVSRTPSGQATLVGLQRADEDAIVRHVVQGKLPNTTYYAQLVSNGQRVGEMVKFKTLPPASGSWTRKIAVVSCQGNKVGDFTELAWADIETWGAHDIWHLGDWGYWGQDIPPGATYKQDLAWYLRSMRGHPTMRRAIQSADLNMVTISDHELAINGDPTGGIHNSPESIRELVAFQKLFPVRQYGDTRDPRRGRYYSFDIGSAVRVIGTDFRSPDRSNIGDLDGPHKTMFGQVQLDWLLRTLDPSRLNVIANETAWLADPNVGPDRPVADKPWSYLYEQQTLVNYIQQHDLKVAWVGGDRHYVGYLRGTDDGSGVYNTLGGFPCYISSGTYKNSIDTMPGELMTWRFGADLGEDREVCQYLRLNLSYDAPRRVVTISVLGRAVLDTTLPTSEWRIENIPGGTAKDTWVLA